MDKTCNKCNVILKITINWRSSSKKYKIYRCNKCSTAVRKTFVTPFDTNKRKEYVALHRLNNIDTYRERGRINARSIKGKAYSNAKGAKRRAQKYNTKISEESKELTLFYLNCPKGYEVDHIIPLSKNGSHTLANLQYLTIHENRIKSNKLPKEGVL